MQQTSKPLFRPVPYIATACTPDPFIDKAENMRRAAKSRRTCSVLEPRQNPVKFGSLFEYSSARKFWRMENADNHEVVGANTRILETNWT